MQMYNNLLLRGPKIDLKSKNMGFVLSVDKDWVQDKSFFLLNNTQNVNKLAATFLF